MTTFVPECALKEQPEDFYPATKLKNGKYSVKCGKLRVVFNEEQLIIKKL